MFPVFGFYRVSGHAALHNPRTAGNNACLISVYVTPSLLAARVNLLRLTRNDNTRDII